MQEVLAAAARTPYYRGAPPRCVENAVPVSVAFVHTHLDLFRDPAAKPRRQREFEHAQQPAPETLILDTGFQAGPLVRVANHWAPNGVHALESLAGAPHQLISLALAHSRPRITRSIVALVGPHYGALSPEDRDLLWISFGVPVYEQFRGLGSELLASECDAHEGLHIADHCALFEAGDELLVTSLIYRKEPVLRLRTGLRARVTTTVCGCGDTAPRLVGLERVDTPGPILTPPMALSRPASAGC